MFSFKLLGKTHIPHRKNTQFMPSSPLPVPSEVLLPMLQHIGAPAIPIVKVGERVKLGQKIAEANGPVSSPVHASVSGTVTKIEDYLRPDGKTVSAVRIASDGLMEKYEKLTPPDVHDIDSFLAAIFDSGVVGLGGAGFPAAKKIEAVKSGKIDTVIINGAECEPYITSDTRTMLDKTDYITYGIQLFASFVPSIKSYIFGIEKNKPECIEKLTAVFSDCDGVSVKALPSLYPQGGEKVLIYNVTGRVVKEGELPFNTGVLVINVATLAAIARYVKEGMPLVEKIVTVDGSAIKEPKNITAPIGASIRELVDFAGGLKEAAGKIIFGGPMMGVAARSFDEPIAKTTNAITVLNVKDSRFAEPTACIHCGRCVMACPMHLKPTAFSKALEYENQEERISILKDEKILLCIECGCCSYVCPAKRPLVENNRIAKSELREYNSHMATLKK